MTCNKQYTDKTFFIFNRSITEFKLAQKHASTDPLCTREEGYPLCYIVMDIYTQLTPTTMSEEDLKGKNLEVQY